MKNIYEDENERPQDDIRSGGVPAPPIPEPPAQPQPELPNLTPEQITALLQLLAQQQQQKQQQPAPQPAPQPTPAAVPETPRQPSPQDAGRRILYQSADFEPLEKEEKNRPRRPAPDPGTRIAYQAKDLGEDDLQRRRRQATAPQGNFSVNEFSLVDDQDDDAPPFSDIAVKEVDEATESFRTQRARRFTPPPEPQPPVQTAPPAPEAASDKEPAPLVPAPPLAPAPQEAPAPSDSLPEAEPKDAAPELPEEDDPSPSSGETNAPEDEAEAAPEGEEVQLKEKKPRVKKPWSSTRKAVLVISLTAIVASFGVLGWEYKLHKDNLKLEDEVSALILETQVAPRMSGGNTIVLTEEQQWAQLHGEFPNVAFPEGIQLKYARLYATNPDFAGYLEIPGVNLSLPVVQTDNDADYLKKNFYGKSTKYGCPFVSCINNIADLDFNTVVYGHHMNDRTIFGALDAYKHIDGFRNAPVITFNTLYADYSWKVVAAFLTNAVPADDNGYVFNYFFNQLSTDEKKNEYFAALRERSLYDTGVDVLPSDKLLTLSTCSHEFDDARLVVVARLVRPDEAAEVDTSLATLNSSPHYPQAYYSKKKQTNPYAATPRWEVG